MFSAIEESAEYVYPEDYAGTYYNQYDDNKMTLYLTNFDNLNYYQTFFDSDICHFELVEYSYNDLTTLFDYLSYSMVELDLNTVSIDELNNCVKVGINEDMSNKDIVDYVESLGYDIGMVTFEYNVREEFTECANAYGGDMLFTYNQLLSEGSYSITPNAAATVGYNAYNPTTNQYGIVTAGHLLNSNTSNYMYVNDNNSNANLINSNHSGLICQDDVTVDALFIPFNSNFVPSIYIRNFLDSNSSIYTLKKEQYITSPSMVNMTVYSFGITTGIQQGKMTATSKSVKFSDDDYEVINFIQTSIVTQPGDSGGPLVFFISESLNQVGLLGICKGSDDTYSYFCKYNVINSALGLETYSYDYIN